MLFSLKTDWIFGSFFGRRFVDSWVQKCVNCGISSTPSLISILWVTNVKPSLAPLSMFYFSHFVISIVQGLTIFVSELTRDKVKHQRTHISSNHVIPLASVTVPVVDPAVWHHVEGNEHKNVTLWNRTPDHDTHKWKHLRHTSCVSPTCIKSEQQLAHLQSFLALGTVTHLNCCKCEESPEHSHWSKFPMQMWQNCVNAFPDACFPSHQSQMRFPFLCFSVPHLFSRANAVSSFFLLRDTKWLDILSTKMWLCNGFVSSETAMVSFHSWDKKNAVNWSQFVTVTLQHVAKISVSLCWVCKSIAVTNVLLRSNLSIFESWFFHWAFRQSIWNHALLCSLRVYAPSWFFGICHLTLLVFSIAQILKVQKIKIVFGVNVNLQMLLWMKHAIWVFEEIVTVLSTSADKMFSISFLFVLTKTSQEKEKNWKNPVWQPLLTTPNLLQCFNNFHISQRAFLTANIDKGARQSPNSVCCTSNIFHFW